MSPCPFYLGQPVLVLPCSLEPAVIGRISTIERSVYFDPLRIWLHQIAVLPTKRGLPFFFQSEHLVPLTPPQVQSDIARTQNA